MGYSDSEKVTLITGATRGIGRACADVLAACGHRVIGLARAEPDEFPGDFFSVDFTDRGALDARLRELGDRYSINGLVNNVGFAGPELLDDIDLQTVDSVFQLNVGAAIACAQYCARSMKACGGGRIVSISSELALGLPTRTAYGGAKAALISITRTWALELARDAITANCVAPGPVNTEFFMKNNPIGSAERERKLNRIPLGRFGEPVDIANSVAFFLSDAAEYVTGQTLFVDGGSSLASDALF